MLYFLFRQIGSQTFSSTPRLLSTTNVTFDRQLYSDASAHSNELQQLFDNKQQVIQEMESAKRMLDMAYREESILQSRQSQLESEQVDLKTRKHAFEEFIKNGKTKVEEINNNIQESQTARRCPGRPPYPPL